MARVLLFVLKLKFLITYLIFSLIIVEGNFLSLSLAHKSSSANPSAAFHARELDRGAVILR